MRDENFTVIFGWMFNQLGLNSNEAIIYSIIYNFSQDGNSEFSGSFNYIAESVNISRSAIIKIINNLIDKGLIGKRVIIKSNNIKQVYYKANLEKLSFLENKGSVKNTPPINKKLEDSVKSTPNVVEKVHKGSIKSVPNNNILIINNNNINKRGDFEKSPTPKNQSGGQIADKCPPKDNISDLMVSGLSSSTVSQTEIDLVVEKWNTVIEKPKIQKMTPKRKKDLYALINDYGLNTIITGIDCVKEMPFLMGDNDRGWRIDFDFYINRNKFLKIVEGAYETKKRTNNYKTSNERDIDFDEYEKNILNN